MRSRIAFSFSLHLILLIIVLGVVVDWSESGRILRAWRRNGLALGRGPRGPSPWAQFHTHRRSFHGGRRRLPPIHHLRQELAAGAGIGAGVRHTQELPAGDERRAFAGADGKVLGEASLLKPIDPSTVTAAAALPQTVARSSWPFINAIGRSPVLDYVPASTEQVKFVTETQRRAGSGPPPAFRRRPPMRPRFRRPPPPNRFQWNRRKTQYTRQPPLIWKLLASRRNRWRNFRRPPPRQRPGTSQEAQVHPYLPHIVFFQHSDMMHPKNMSITFQSNSTSTAASNFTGSTVLRPGKVTSVPLYPVEPSAPSEFIPIPSAAPGKEYIFRVVELKHLKRPTTLATTNAPAYKSVPTPPPFEPMPTSSTETLKLKEVVDLDPPAPIEDIQINIDAQAEGSEHFLQVLPAPSTSTTAWTTTTLKPIFALREEPAHVEEIIVPRTSAEATAKVKKSGFQHLLPTYNSNKKNTGLAPKKSISSSKEYRDSREDMSSSIMITGIRSKVKEYKPQLLANFTQLIAFDKVITPVVEVMAKPIKPKPAVGSSGFSSRSNADDTPSTSNETTVPSNNIDEGNANASSSTSSSSEESPAQVPAAEVEVTNSTTSVSSSSSESVSFSSSDSPNSISSDNSTTTSTESPMERFDPLKLIHSWFMKS